MEVIGQPEIAKRYRVSLATVWQWRRRYPDFPDPIPGRVAGAPAFDAGKVQAWYAAKWPGRPLPGRQDTEAGAIQLQAPSDERDAYDPDAAERAEQLPDGEITGQLQQERAEQP
jgi:Homeodomain-like domain